MEGKREKLSLLEYLARGAGVDILSDLRQLPDSENRALAQLLERIPEEAASLWEWNDALDYPTGRHWSETSRKAAREQLIQVLSSEQ